MIIGFGGKDGTKETAEKTDIREDDSKLDIGETSTACYGDSFNYSEYQDVAGLIILKLILER
jgi:hypothetical protein